MPLARSIILLTLPGNWRTLEESKNTSDTMNDTIVTNTTETPEPDQRNSLPLVARYVPTASRLHEWAERLTRQPAEQQASTDMERLDLLTHLHNVITGSAAPATHQAQRDIRLLLAMGLCSWYAPLNLPATPPPNLLPTLAAHSLLPLLLLPASQLPLFWQTTLLHISGIQLKSLVALLHIHTQREQFAHPADLVEYTRSRLLAPPYASGAAALLNDLRQPADGGAALGVLREAMGQEAPGMRLLALLPGAIAPTLPPPPAEVWQQFRQQVPANVFVTQADLLIEQGDKAAEQRQFEQAIALYTQALDLEANLPEALLKRGRVYRRSDKTRQALTDLNKLTRMYPDYAEAFHERGLAYVDDNNDRMANNSFHRARKLGYRP